MDVQLRDRMRAWRESEAELKWTGTFWEYFDRVREDPRLGRLSHARIYDLIAEAGVEEHPDGPRYLFFDRDLFGLERTLEQLVEYFHSAARRLEVRKRILLLMGPVGGGKSTLVTLLKRGLEQYSRTSAGALYAIQGCPMHEEPLHLIPAPLRADLEREYGLYVEGDLCPVCQHRLETEWGGDIDQVPVERLALDEKHRVGIGTFAPSDPKSQDIAELTGSIDLATVGEYGSESDPRAYRFDGELNIANRGLMEFIELLKSDEKFLYGLLTLSQEQIPHSPTGPREPSGLSPLVGRGFAATTSPVAATRVAGCGRFGWVGGGGWTAGDGAGPPSGRSTRRRLGRTPLQMAGRVVRDVVRWARGRIGRQQAGTFKRPHVAPVHSLHQRGRDRAGHGRSHDVKPCGGDTTHHPRAGLARIRTCHVGARRTRWVRPRHTNHLRRGYATRPARCPRDQPRSPAAGSVSLGDTVRLRTAGKGWEAVSEAVRTPSRGRRLPPIGRRARVRARIDRLIKMVVREHSPGRPGRLVARSSLSAANGARQPALGTTCKHAAVATRLVRRREWWLGAGHVGTAALPRRQAEPRLHRRAAQPRRSWLMKCGATPAEMIGGSARHTPRIPPPMVGRVWSLTSRGPSVGPRRPGAWWDRTMAALGAGRWPPRAAAGHALAALLRVDDRLTDGAGFHLRCPVSPQTGQELLELPFGITGNFEPFSGPELSQPIIDGLVLRHASASAPGRNGFDFLHAHGDHPFRLGVPRDYATNSGLRTGPRARKTFAAMEAVPWAAAPPESLGLRSPQVEKCARLSSRCMCRSASGETDVNRRAGRCQ
jgi:energy-coupling factor transporter ATP-binding protein EcfA2